MQIVLVGADFEENLGVGMIAAAAQSAGHDVAIHSFNQSTDVAPLAERIAQAHPDVVGISAQFQHRAADFLQLAQALRERGYRGHVTCGGQFPTLAYRDVLAAHSGVDSVVLYDGEHTIVELLAALADGGDLHGVPGLAVRANDGAPVRTADRPPADPLDELPFATRYRPHSRHMGVPFVPIMGSRGCWGSCSYCSITSVYRDARAHHGGRTLRHRTPGNIAAEMALLQSRQGEACVFCFHDDNFLLPRPDASLARVRAIREAFEAYGVGPMAMIGKCRPDSMTRELARALREAGVLRLYVGVENGSPDGAEHLNRRTQHGAVREALAACREAGIFVCYNLLLFEPRATIDIVRENVRFIREHASHPVNFCRAEPYVGTPLQLDLASRGALAGSFLGWSYRLDDDRAEMLFRVCAAAFRQRNFDPDGVANRYMGLGYCGKLLEHFYSDRDGKRPALLRRVQQLTRAISLDTADHLEQAIAIAECRDVGDRDGIERETALLGLRVAATDAIWHTELDALYGDMEAFAAASRTAAPRFRVPREMVRAAQRIALGASIAATATAAAACRNNPPPTTMQPNPQSGDNGPARPAVTDPVPGPMVVDPPPPPMRDAGAVYVPAPDPVPPPPPRVVDPAPPPIAPDPVPRPPTVVDPVPRPPPHVDAGTPHRRPRHTPPNDPAPRAPDPVPSPKPLAALPLIDQWRNTTARGTADDRLPLSRPPEIALAWTREDGGVRVRVTGYDAPSGTRWQSRGVVVGDGREVLWMPSSRFDQLRVAVRTGGGVAIAALRAVDVGLSADANRRG